MTRAALAGFPRALNDLGVMAETGVGGAPDPERAAELYEAAARAGDPLGAWNLADLLMNPGLAPTDRRRAMPGASGLRITRRMPGPPQRIATAVRLRRPRFPRTTGRAARRASRRCRLNPPGEAP
jgi:TPR repeat protein